MKKLIECDGMTEFADNFKTKWIAYTRRALNDCELNDEDLERKVYDLMCMIVDSVLNSTYVCKNGVKVSLNKLNELAEYYLREFCELDNIRPVITATKKYLTIELKDKDSDED